MTPLTLALALVPLATAPLDDKLHADLPAVLAQAAEGELVPVAIVLAEQVPPDELRAVRTTLAKSARRAYVRSRLREVADATQGELLELLEEHARAGRADRIRSLWIHNVVGARVTPAVALAIAERDDVAYLHHDPPAGEDIFLAAPAAGSLATTCGLNLINAPQVWSQYGIDGHGVVVGVIDSGICPTHPDIANQIWTNPCEIPGNSIDDDANGFVDDTWGWDFENNDNDPDDTVSHGSHVAGTVAGDGTQGTMSGVAPGVEVMSLKIFGSFSGEQSVWDCMQYGLDNGADVLTASLGWPHSQNPDRATWRAVCDNTIAAGIVVIYAAGNEGCCCAPDNVRTPADVPDVICVGAVDCNDNLASFSSCGPVTWQSVPPYNDHPFPPGLIKPDVSGPGVSTDSHLWCNGYAPFSGTSMATPHVAGTAALILQADSSLDHFGVRAILEGTSVDMGAPGKDNLFGSGRIDALAAVTSAIGNGNWCAPKMNSCGGTPVIDGSGMPSATAPSGFTVSATGMVANKVALLIYSDQGPANVPLLGGALCVNQFSRSVPVFSNGTPGTCDGIASIDMNAFRAGALGGNPKPFLSVPGTTVTCQFWGRDGQNTFGALLTGGYEYTICP